MNNNVLSLMDAVIAPILIIIIFYFEKSRKDKKIGDHPEYKYYIPGLLLKMFGAISVCLVYTLYYQGGDTVNYYTDAVSLSKLLVYNPAAFFQIYIHGFDRYFSEIFYFSEYTGYPVLYADPKTYFVVRLMCLPVVITFHSFISASLLLAWISFGGVWRMYKVFVSEFPHLSKQLAISSLFIPSVCFWGSGILKDTFTFSALGFYFYSFHMVVVRKEKIFLNFWVVLSSVAVIIAIKPYIFIGLLPGSAFWIMRKYTKTLEGSFLKTLITPVAILVMGGGLYLLLHVMSGNLGRFSLNNVFQEAANTQKDLKNDFYKGNTFDIGDFDPTPSAMLSKSPLAIQAALFRPYLWESKNIMMLMSGLENAFILGFTLYLLVKVRILGLFKFLNKHYILVFSLTFSLFFAFSVGISTSNFGSLVRYRIPLIPFYLSSLYIINYYHGVEKKKKMELTYEAFSAYA